MSGVEIISRAQGVNMMTVAEVKRSLRFFRDLYNVCRSSETFSKYASYYAGSLEYFEVILNNKKVVGMTDDIYQEFIAELKRIQLDFLDLTIVFA